MNGQLVENGAGDRMGEMMSRDGIAGDAEGGGGDDGGGNGSGKNDGWSGSINGGDGDDDGDH